jgi:hypothetical protein
MTRIESIRFHAFFQRWSRLARAALSVCLLLLVAACGTAPRPAAEASREELEDFRQTMQDDAEKIGEYIAKLQSGKNISELTIGWFVYDVLTELASQDDKLYYYFNNKDHDLQLYLKIQFHDHPLAEIAALDTLARQGHPTLRLAARSALESLRHIPNSEESADIQSRDRRALAGALAISQDLLEKSAREVVLPAP